MSARPAATHPRFLSGSGRLHSQPEVGPFPLNGGASVGRPPPHRVICTSRAFTLVEVMVASVVLVFGIISAIAVMQQGAQSVDYARNLSQATQLMQSEVEHLRLKNWAQIEELQNQGDAVVRPESAGGRKVDRFICIRKIRDVKSGMKEITLTASWNGFDGTPHEARFITRYGRNGLNDFISTAH